MMPLRLNSVTDPAPAGEVSESIPAACMRWMPGLAPEAAETWVRPVAAQPLSPAIALRNAADLHARIAAAALAPTWCGAWAPGPSPQPVERFVAPVMAAAARPAVARPGFHAFSAAEPRLAPAFTEELQSVPAAEPAATFVAPSAASAIPYAAPITLPSLSELTVAETQQIADQAAIPAARTTHLPLPSAEPVEIFVAASMANALPYAALITARPLALTARLTVTPPAASTRYLPLHAEPVEMFVEASMAGAVAYPVSLSMPRPVTVAGTSKVRFPARATGSGYCRTPRAEAAELFVAMRSAEAIAKPVTLALPAIAALQLDTSLDPQQDDVIPEAATACRSVPAAEAAETEMLPALAANVASLPSTRVPELAAIEIAAGSRTVAQCGYLPGLAAQPVETIVVPSIASRIEFSVPAAIAPTAASLSIVETHVGSSSRLARSLEAEPAEDNVHALASLVPVSFAPTVPRVEFRFQLAAGPLAPPVRTASPEPEMPAAADAPQVPQVRGASILQFPGATAISGRRSEPVQPQTASVAPPAESTAAEPVESMPSPAKIQPLPVVPQVLAPFLPLKVSAGSQLAPLEFGTVLPAEQAPLANPVRRPAILEPVAVASARFSMSQPKRPVPAIPFPGPFALEFYCQRVAGVASQRLRWLEPEILAIYQAFSLKVAANRTEDLFAKAPKKQAAVEKVRVLPLPTKAYNGVGIGLIGKIAAGLLVASFLWTGGRMMTSGGRQSNATSDLSAPAESTPVASNHGTGAVPTGPESTGPLARVKKAIAERASVEVADTFRGGMQAWGGTGNTPVAGWSKHPDGYMRTGELALFRPSQNFTDYRLEFYGQIENKSMGWVVRAQDKQNYQAMKFTVVEPGLRPVIAMVHYPVVGGKRGHKVETPLSVMVHNHRPYHVTVDVRGNHFRTSIEGEEVDSFTDDTLASGGIGFFSEAGDKARLYWAKVSKNQDWLGRICAYMTADGPRRTAEVWGPGGAPGRSQPGDPFTGESTLAAAFIGFTKFRSNAQKRRIPLWTC
jgi:hypothetical protein